MSIIIDILNCFLITYEAYKYIGRINEKIIVIKSILKKHINVYIDC